MDRPVLVALGAAALLVVAAAGAGRLAADALARPPSPPPVTPPSSAATAPGAAPRDDDVWRQPLSAGCATSSGVWVVSDGGGIARFDGERWSLVDRTLRSLVSAACVRDTMLAVGGAGRVVTADDVARTVQVDTVLLEDLSSVALLPDGSLVVGQRGTVLRQVPAGWASYARGIEEDLFGVAAFSASAAWTVGAQGVSYRLEEGGWRPVPTEVSTTLRAVGGGSVSDVVAVGDAGTVLLWQGRWTRLDVGTSADLRAVLHTPGRSWIGGDRGTVLHVSTVTREASRVDLGTSCAIRGIFARGQEIWLVGSDGPLAGVWRLAGDRVDRWGLC
jgi:hypothetical protein